MLMLALTFFFKICMFNFQVSMKKTFINLYEIFPIWVTKFSLQSRTCWCSQNALVLLTSELWKPDLQDFKGHFQENCSRHSWIFSDFNLQKSIQGWTAFVTFFLTNVKNTKWCRVYPDFKKKWQEHVQQNQVWPLGQKHQLCHFGFIEMCNFQLIL